jgi:AcrR family transcriptional regulator
MMLSMRGVSTVADPKAHVLATAARLFYEHGIGAVGIERVQEQSGVARATIYRHFQGKNGLVLAFVEQRDEHWRAWLRDRVEAISPAPAGRPLAALDAIAERLASSGFRGCAFTNTIAEFPDPEHPAHAAARRHKDLVVEYLTVLCAEAGVDDAPTAARQLMLLIDGAIVGAVREGSAEPARTAKAAARVLLGAPHDGCEPP